MSSHHDIENLLRQMPLAKPSADLDKRVMDALAAGAADCGTADYCAAGQETRRAVALRQPRSRRSWLIGAFVGALAAAAVVMMVVGLPQNTGIVTPGQQNVSAPVEVARSTPPLAPTASVEPVRLEQNWSEVSDEGIVCPDPQTPLRTFRHRTVDRVQFFDPQRNIRMETTVPREEFIFVKAPMQ
jgi:negative regulator of sigma E activity